VLTEAEKAGGIGKLLLPFVKDRVKVQYDEGGTPTVQVVDDNGKPRYDNDGKFMSVTDLLTEMKSDSGYAPLFKGNENSGGGAQPGSGGNSGGGTPNVDRSKMSVQEKSDYISKHGQEAYLNLPMSQPEQKSTNPASQ